MSIILMDNRDRTELEQSIQVISDRVTELSGSSIIEPAESDIPKVFIDGVIPTTKDDVLAELTYISKSLSFHAYIEIKC